MRDENEVEQLYTALQNQEMEAAKWDGDNFKYGLYCGKLLALEYVIGQRTGGQIGIPEDYEGFIREQQVEIQDLRERLSRGTPKPDDRQEESGDDFSRSTSVIRLDHSRLMKMENDNSIVEQVALADVITARTNSNERETCVFKRPMEEIVARGLPYNIQTLQFSVQNVKDLRHLTNVISRMKQGQ